MTVSTIASVAAGLSRTLGNQTSKASIVFDSVLSATSKQVPADVTAKLGAATELQNQIAQFRVASQNVAQAGSLLTSAQTGANDVAKKLATLKEFATQATAADATDATRAPIDVKLQAVRAELTDVVENTSFGNEPLLTGKSPLINSFREDVLFPFIYPDPLKVTTEDSARKALEALAAAEVYVAQQSKALGSLQDGLDFASATLQSAIQNQDAARSVLSDADFDAVQTASPIKADDVSSLVAQTNRLPTNILQLLSE